MVASTNPAIDPGLLVARPTLARVAPDSRTSARVVSLPRRTTPARASTGSAGHAVSQQLAALVEALLGREQGVRTDRPDGVRKMRTAARRLRSALSTYRSLLRADEIDPVIGELRWLGAELGRARDLAALCERLDAVTGATALEPGTGRVLEELEFELRSRYRQAHVAVLDALDGRRGGELRVVLHAMAEHVPLTDEAERCGPDEIERLVGRTVRRVRKRAAVHAALAPGDPGRDVTLHAVRNAAKRSRHAAELAAPTLGKRVGRLGRRMHDLQDVLGEWHDATIFGRLLHDVGEVATATNASAFTIGVLYEREQERLRGALSRYEPVLRKALTLW